MELFLFAVLMAYARVRLECSRNQLERELSHNQGHFLRPDLRAFVALGKFRLRMVSGAYLRHYLFSRWNAKSYPTRKHARTEGMENWSIEILGGETPAPVRETAGRESIAQRSQRPRRGILGSGENSTGGHRQLQCGKQLGKASQEEPTTIYLCQGEIRG